MRECARAVPPRGVAELHAVGGGPRGDHAARRRGGERVERAGARRRRGHQRRRRRRLRRRRVQARRATPLHGRTRARAALHPPVARHPAIRPSAGPALRPAHPRHPAACARAVRRLLQAAACLLAAERRACPSGGAPLRHSRHRQATDPRAQARPGRPHHCGALPGRPPLPSIAPLRRGGLRSDNKRIPRRRTRLDRTRSWGRGG
mmetsp:Transcript_2413/g.6023  ORF Transcript_2413/g.6023 Transcript_2413/m.6023 type:complete len:205 (-) Transcript_2413:712-1326(-)